MSDKTVKGRTASETLFESYLVSRGLEFDFEPVFSGKSRSPDYRLNFEGRPALIEVKEFIGDPRARRLGAGAFDPYPPIREKIEAGRKKFREFKEFPCALLLHNVSGNLIWIDRPRTVISAMLGDVGFQVDFDPAQGKSVGDMRTVFLGRGKMRDYKRNSPQNRTIGAIMVLEQYPLGVKRFAQEDRRAKAEGRELTEEQEAKLLEAAGDAVLRIKVHENPWANHRFPRELFVGDFDEHWTWDDESYLRRSFVGPALAAVEVGVPEG